MMKDKPPKAKPPLPKRPDTGEVAPNRIPIYDHDGNMRGHVGHRATGATVARFLGRHGADLKPKDGRIAWVGHKPPPPKPVMPVEPPAPAPKFIINATSGDKPKAANVAAAKGSVKKAPAQGMK